jgi:uncharacterized lipoprotein YajG
MVLFFGMMMIQACAKKPYIDLTYQLPAPSASQAGKQVCLSVVDSRQERELFSNTAKKEFENFTGFFNLTVVGIDKKRSQIGAYELEQLFQKTLEQRLQNMGVDVLKACDGQYPTIQVTIKTFKIDLADRKWKAQVSYETSLTTDGKNFIKESVTGKADRVKIVGSKAAQTVVGELFTDMINRLNINRLFDQSM